MKTKLIEWFMRVSLSIGFLSACADRFGLWPVDMTAWGNWPNFVAYTHKLLPFLSEGMANIAAVIATALEILLAILLLTNFRTSLIAKCSGFLLLTFALAMALSLNIKAPLDYSVFIAAAAAFGLSALVKERKKRTSRFR